MPSLRSRSQPRRSTFVALEDASIEHGRKKSFRGILPSRESRQNKKEDNLRRAMEQGDAGYSSPALSPKPALSDASRKVREKLIKDDSCLILHIIKANLDDDEKKDMVMVVRWGEEARYTSTRLKTHKPYWNEEFKFPFTGCGEISLMLMEQRIATTYKNLGGSIISVSDDAVIHRLQAGKMFNQDLDLTHKDNVVGKVQIRLELSDNWIGYREMSANSKNLCPHWIVPTNRHISLRLLQGKVPAADATGFSDPFVEIELGTFKARSKIQIQTLNPTWNEDFVVPVPYRTPGVESLQGDELKPEKMTIGIYDWDATGDDHLGATKIDLQNIPGHDGSITSMPEPAWYPMNDKSITLSGVRLSATRNLGTKFYSFASSVRGKIKPSSTTYDEATFEEPKSGDSVFSGEIAANVETSRTVPDRATRNQACQLELSMWYDKSYDEVVKCPVGKVTVDIMNVILAADGRQKRCYVVIRYLRHWIMIPPVLASKSAVYDRQFEFTVQEPDSVITIGVFESIGGIGNDKLMGIININISNLPRAKIVTTYSLYRRRADDVKRCGYLTLALTWEVTRFPCFIKSYFAAPNKEELYYRPLNEEQETLLKKQKRAITIHYMKRISNSPREEAVLAMTAWEVPHFEVAIAKANVERVLKAIKPITNFMDFVDKVMKWEDTKVSITANIVAVISVWYPYALINMLLCRLIYLLFKGAGSRGLTKTQLPEADPDLYGGLCNEQHMNGKKEIKAMTEAEMESMNPYTAVKKKLHMVEGIGLNIQLKLGLIATQLERIQSIFAWTDPFITTIITSVLSVLLVAIWLLPPAGDKMVLTFGVVFALRHPRFRDPVPPPPVNLFMRLSSKEDNLLWDGMD